MIKEYLLINLFNDFIKDTTSGNRLKPDGKKVKSKTIQSYRNALYHLRGYEMETSLSIRIRPINKLSIEQMMAEKKYWGRFYNGFTSYLYKQGLFDNYVGTLIRCIRTVFHYAEKDKLISVGKFYLDFFITKQDVPIVTLMPEQLQKMIYDKVFEESLSIPLKRAKDIFVVGCTVALRFSDLLAIKWQNIVTVADFKYLEVISQKSNQQTRIKLPRYVTEILDRYKKEGSNKKIFKSTALPRFNANISKIAELAGYTQIIGKFRSKQGEMEQIIHRETGNPYRFCDLITSHTMRRTAVTTMLMHGVPENVVKKISGHVGNSRAFYRYVNFVEAYMDTEIDKHYEKMNPNSKKKKGSKKEIW